jgi:hypothetical protein
MFELGIAGVPDGISVRIPKDILLVLIDQPIFPPPPIDLRFLFSASASAFLKATTYHSMLSGIPDNSYIVLSKYVVHS